MCFLLNYLELNGHSEEFRIQNAIFRFGWQEIVNVHYEQISFLRLLGSSSNLSLRILWQTKGTNDKTSRQLSLWRRGGDQPDEAQNEQQQQQQQQPANHSSKSGEATPWSAHESFDVGPVN